MTNKTQIIDGKAMAEEIKKEIRREIVKKNLRPNLAVVLVGDDPASHLYVKLKQKACQQVGIEFHKYYLAGDISNEEVLEVINFLNNDKEIDALLVQLPLSQHLNENLILKSIAPNKDVDCLNPENIKKIFQNKIFIVSPLVQSIIHLLKSTQENLRDKQAYLIIKNNFLLKTLEYFLKNQGIIVRSINPHDSNLAEKTKKADILITAVGEPFFIRKAMVKEGVILIDIGTNQITEGLVVGDADYSEVFPRCSYITPVPGGVGPMTVAMLLKNTILLHQKNLKSTVEPF